MMPASDFELRSQRVRLVPIGPEHQDATRAWANDPELRRRILRVSDVSEEDQRRWLERVRAAEDRLVLAIERAEDGTHVGNTGFSFLDATHRRGEFWILIGRLDDRGRGLGAECLALMLEHGFRALGLHKVHLVVATDNERAIRLYERFGFHRDGLLREHYCIEGRWVDVWHMSLLRREYEQKK
jgi:RimJ/RimL family protein N-acetyltransferase